MYRHFKWDFLKDYKVLEVVRRSATYAVHYKFPNNYGASVIMGPYTYGGDEDKFELAVLSLDKHGTLRLDYSTPLTDDVIGYLTDEEVQRYLIRILLLDKKEHG